MAVQRVARRSHGVSGVLWIAVLAALGLMAYLGQKPEIANPSAEDPSSMGTPDPPVVLEPAVGGRSVQTEDAWLLLRTRGRHGLGLSSALATTSTSVEGHRAWKADADGTIALPPSTWGMSITVEDSGHYDATIEWPEACCSELVVTLQPLPILRGRVITSRGLPVIDKIRVAVWPEDRPCNADDLACSSSPDSPMRIVDCDAEGRFEVSVDRPDARYQVTAGSRGHAMMAPGSLYTTCAECPLELRIAPVYGQRVRLVDPQGEPIQISDELLPNYGPRWATLPGTDSINAKSITAALAGISSLETRSADGPSILALIPVPSNELAVGPISFRATLPGYREAAIDTMLPWIGEGLEESDWLFEPLAQGFGSVSILFDEEDGEILSTSADTFTMCRVVLSPLDHQGPTVGYRLSDCTPGKALLHRIPTGRYRVFLRDWGIEPIDLAPEDPEGRSIEIVVSESTADDPVPPTEVHVPKLEFATIELDLRYADGSNYDGRVAASVGRMIGETNNRYSTLAHFQRSPYTIPFTKSGTFAGMVMAPEEVHLVAEEGLLFQVELGEHRVIEVELGDRPH